MALQMWYSTAVELNGCRSTTAESADGPVWPLHSLIICCGTSRGRTQAKSWAPSIILLLFWQLLIMSLLAWCRSLCLHKYTIHHFLHTVPSLHKLALVAMAAGVLHAPNTCGPGTFLNHGLICYSLRVAKSVGIGDGLFPQTCDPTSFPSWK